MPILKVCLTGSHGTGKTFIVERLQQLANQSGVQTQVIESPTRYIKSLGFGNNHQLDFKTEWMCMAKRVERQRLALQEIEKPLDFKKKIEPGVYSDKKLILADRCLLDELSYTKEAIERLRGPEWELQQSLELPYTETGDPAYQLSQFYQIAYRFVFDDVLQYWDRVYYKPPHPDFPPEEDGDRLGDESYQASVDQCIQHHWRDLDTKDNLKSLAQLCDRDRTIAVEEIWDEIEMELDLERD